MKFKTIWLIVSMVLTVLLIIKGFYTGNWSAGIAWCIVLLYELEKALIKIIDHFNEPTN